MKHYLFHVTSPANLWSIINNGLSRRYGWAVYLCEDPRNWWRPGMEIIRVRTTGLKGELKKWPDMDEILYFGDIGPGRCSRWIPPRGWFRAWAKEHPGEKPLPPPGPALTKEERVKALVDYMSRNRQEAE